MSTRPRLQAFIIQENGMHPNKESNYHEQQYELIGLFHVQKWLKVSGHLREEEVRSVSVSHEGTINQLQTRQQTSYFYYQ